jgi:hypothetical protein
MVDNAKILQWIRDNGVKTNKGLPIEFRDHGFLLDFVRDTAKKIVVRKCVHPDTRVLTSALKWVAIKNINQGDELVGISEHTPIGKGSRRMFEKTIVCDKHTVKKESFKLTLEDGRSIIASGDHPFLGIKRSISAWKTVKELKCGDQLRVISNIWTDALNYEDGWMAGIMDGEGSLKVHRTGGGNDFVISQRPGAISNRVENYLKKNKFKYHVRDDHNTGDIVHRNGPIRRIVLSRLSDIMELLGKTQTTRWIDSKFWEGQVVSNFFPSTQVRIKSIEKLGTIEMIDIETSSRTFIAEGIISHNCTQVGASYSVIVKVLHLGSQSPLTIIYTLPTIGDAKSFVLSKFDPIIERSQGLRDSVSKVVFRDKPIYNSEVKRIGDSYYFFKGSWTTFGAQSIDADVLCVDNQTEILTDQGWKFFKDLNKKESVVTLGKDNIMEYQRPTKYINYIYSGEMLELETDTINFSVIPKHNIYVKKQHKKNFELIPAEKVYNYQDLEFKKDAKWYGKKISKWVIPELMVSWYCGHEKKQKRTRVYNEKRFDPLVFAEFLGLFISEGCTSAQHSKYRNVVRISQNEGEIFDRIKELARMLSYKYFISENQHGCKEIRIHDTQLAEYLYSLCGNYSSHKRIDRSVLVLETKILKALFVGLMLGDGAKSGKYYSTNSYKLANDFQELLLKIGMAGNIQKQKTTKIRQYECKPCYTITINRYNLTPRIRRPVLWNKREYNGRVYCVSVPNKIIFVRRNGKVHWTGNCVDELDFQKPDVKEMWEERTEGSSSLSVVYWVGYPSIPGFGIEEIYESSDQRSWFIKCGHCGKLQSLTWPDSIDFVKEIYQCKYCHKELTPDMRRKGMWKAKFPGREIHGYYINKLMAPWISAAHIIDRFKKDTPKKFFNFTLGLPYLNKKSDITDDVINNSMVDEDEFIKFKQDPGTKVIVGIDQGDIFHFLVALANETGILVCASEELRSEDELLAKLKFYRPDLVIMDMFPNRHTAKKMREDYGRDKLYMGKERNWTETMSKERFYYKLDRTTGEVGIERTESLDEMLELIVDGHIKFRRTCPRLRGRDKSNPGIIEMIKNLVPDVLEQHGRMRRVYKAVGPDHYGHALNFIVTAVHILFPSFKTNRYNFAPVAAPKPEVKKPWYHEDFQKRIDSFAGNDSIIIKPQGRSLDPTQVFPRDGI